MHRWLFLATRCAWLRQPDDVRVRFAPERRIPVRTELERIADDFKRAVIETEPKRRSALANRAMIELLEVIGQGDREGPVSDAFSEGIERVESTLSPGPLRSALDALRQGPSSSALSPVDFRALSELFLWTFELIDTRTPRERQLEPWMGRGALVLALLAVAWIFFGSHNISHGRDVSASSICPLSPQAPYARPRLYRVVDGVRSEDKFAVCTKKEVNPWIQVDLEETRTVTSVVVHTRSDCCWGQEDTPLSVQLSVDGKDFKTVAVQSGFILPEFPFTASFSSRQARYVRLMNESSESKNIVISEIEVHGR